MDAEEASRLVRSSLERAAVGLARQGVAAATRSELTPRDLLALWHIARIGEATPTSLGDVLQLSSSGTTTLINRLCAIGLLTRVPGTSARRRVLVRSTVMATNLLDEVLAPFLADLDALIGDARPAERELAARFLSRMATLAERHGVRAANAAQDVTRARLGGEPPPAVWG